MVVVALPAGKWRGKGSVELSASARDVQKFPITANETGVGGGAAATLLVTCFGFVASADEVGAENVVCCLNRLLLFVCDEYGQGLNQKVCERL